MLEQVMPGNFTIVRPIKSSNVNVFDVLLKFSICSGNDSEGTGIFLFLIL